MELTRYGAFLDAREGMRNAITLLAAEYLLHFAVPIRTIFVALQHADEVRMAAAADFPDVVVNAKEWVHHPMVFCDYPLAVSVIAALPAQPQVLPADTVPHSQPPVEPVSTAQVKRDRKRETAPPPQVVRMQRSGAGAHIKIGDLLGAGLLTPGEELRYNRNSERAAILTTDGRLQVGDRTSTIHQVGLHSGQLTSCNGWVSWYVLRDDTWTSLDQLRAGMRDQNDL